MARVVPVDSFGYHVIVKTLIPYIICEYYDKMSNTHVFLRQTVLINQSNCQL